MTVSEAVSGFIPRSYWDTPTSELPPLTGTNVIRSSRLSVTPIYRGFLCEPLDSLYLQRVSGMDTRFTAELFTGDFIAVVFHLTRLVSLGDGFLNGISRS